MNGLGWLILLVAIALPIAWLVSEFQPRRWVRVVLGISAIVVSCGVTFLATTVITRFNYNSYYGFSNKQLIDTTIIEIEAGRTDVVVAELKQLQSEFHPTYEYKAHYDELVEQAASRMKGPGSATQPAK